MVSSEKDPKKIWKMLADTNNSKYAKSVHTLRNELLNIRIREFVKEICTIECKIAFAGKSIDEADKK